MTSAIEFKGWQKPIRENPANWLRDRSGACAAYPWGDTELLNWPRVAFVASQGFYAREFRPRRIWARGSAKAAPLDKESERGGDKRGSWGATGGDKESERGQVLISTFTSAQEREALKRALAKRRPISAVFPSGIPAEGEMVAGLAPAIREGWVLAISPRHHIRN